MNNKPIIIVGFGLAGITMAWQLHFRNLNFIVIGDAENTCTRAAAGLVNPIVFKRLNLSWLVKDLMPTADNFYQLVASHLKVDVRRHLPIVKIFNSYEDENNWVVKQSNPEFKQYLGDINEHHCASIHMPFGSGSVNTIGHLDTVAYMTHSRRYFEGLGYKFMTEKFDYTALDSNNGLYKSLPFQQVIFCEGYGLKTNPFFNYLPLNGTHGDTLIIKSTSLQASAVINKNMFIMPLGNDLYKVGATYNWTKKVPEPTEVGKNELLEKMRLIADFDFEVVSQQAGIRPTVTDRRPLIGTHPQYTNLSVFNGLGTKGVMLAPYFSDHLINHLQSNTELNVEVNISRFEKFLT
ncbi:MAG: FAD-binding oxidoreductase [Putridiphycobacter sp.]|nr:FAD-binding oxidoreductase [Putridiphycobacter sp.]